MGRAMSRADYCYSPLGWDNGDSDRYLPAVLHGCVPVRAGPRGGAAPPPHASTLRLSRRAASRVPPPRTGASRRPAKTCCRVLPAPAGCRQLCRRARPAAGFRQ
eukprot:5738413-Prymnesium_polylepis.1